MQMARLALLRRSSSGREGSSTEDLVQWVRQQGGRLLPAVHLQRQNVRGDLGLVATEAVQSGESLIALPPHILLSLPIDEPALAALAQRVPEKLWAMKLGLKLLAERAKKHSFWWPYIHKLPERFRMPVFFSGDEIQQLQYPPIIHQVKKRCEFLLQFAAEDIPNIIRDRGNDKHPFGGQQVDASALGWAMAAVSSRAFCVKQSGESGCPSLLPLVDMCNHSFTPTARLVQHHTSSAQLLPFLEVVAQQDLERGDALLLDYGPLSNDILLLDYGFVIPNNPHDRVELRFELQLLEAACFAAGLHAPSSFTEPAPWQHALLVQLKLQGPDASQMVTLGGKDQVDCRLLAAVRLLYSEDGSKIRSMGVEMLQSWDAPTALLGLANECKVLRTLVGLCMLATAPFPTSISEDQDLLNRDDISENIRLATEFRTNKKQLLINTISSLQLRLQSLTMQELVSAPR
ncbi:unnamed protein product [Sphagnum balticum]